MYWCRESASLLISFAYINCLLIRLLFWTTGSDIHKICISVCLWAAVISLILVSELTAQFWYKSIYIFIGANSYPHCSSAYSVKVYIKLYVTDINWCITNIQLKFVLQFWALTGFKLYNPCSRSRLLTFRRRWRLNLGGQTKQPLFQVSGIDV